MNCKNCGAQARLYGFCEKCWEKIWTGVDTAKTEYEEELSAGPLDPREQQMIFDNFVTRLWMVFKPESKEKRTEKPKDKPKYVLLTEDDIIEPTDEEWDDNWKWRACGDPRGYAIVGHRLGDVRQCNETWNTPPFRRRIDAVPEKKENP